MGDHYLPRYYLKGFLEDSRREKICRYEKGKTQVITASLTKVAQENDLYSPELETYLNTEIEVPSKEILDKIRAFRKISPTEKLKFSEYIVVMMARIPEMRIKVGAWFEKIKEPAFDNFETDLIRMLTLHPDKKEIIERRLKELREIREKGRIKPEGVWHGVIAPERFPKILWAIQNMTWRFLVSKDSGFLTGDNPIFYPKDIGLKDIRAELSFPISKDVALLATWPVDKDCQFRSAKESAVKEINRRTVSFALRYVFYHRYEQWIINLVNKGKTRIRKLEN
jgi:hypothetical protein